MNTIENNRLIAEFLCTTQTTDGLDDVYIFKGMAYHIENLPFSVDWNWLMEAVCEVFKKETFIKDDLIFKLNDALLECNKDSLYLAVLNCVKWYNYFNL